MESKLVEIPLVAPNLSVIANEILLERQRERSIALNKMASLPTKEGPNGSEIVLVEGPILAEEIMGASFETADPLTVNEARELERLWIGGLVMAIPKAPSEPVSIVQAPRLVGAYRSLPLAKRAWESL